IVTNVVGNIFDMSQLLYNIQVIIPFGLGALAGILLFSRILEKALNTYPKESYFAILGFIIGSIFAIFFEIKDPSTGSTHDAQTPIYQNLFSFLSDNLLSFSIGIILFIIGIIISKRLTDLEHPKQQ
ncbi:MAG: undecaprenyl phosphate translocase family protein, partial [Bacillota bacterium]